MSNLARWCFRHRRSVVAGWVVGLILIGAASGAIGASYSSQFNLPNTESSKAIDALTAHAKAQSGETDTIVVHAKSGTLDDAASRGHVDAMLRDVAGVPHVTKVDDMYNTPGQINADRTIGFVSVQLDQQAMQVPIADVKSIISKAQSIDSNAIQVELGGSAIQQASGGGPGGGPTEFIGVAVAAVVLFLAFGSIYTMFLPLATALLALGTGISLIGFVTHAFSIASFGPTLAALIGLGVGIDYALFIVSRHRVNLQLGMSPEDAAISAINTSGRAVLFAGTTVCIGILGLMLLGVSFFYGLAISVVVVVLMTMFAALTFLPAMLGFVGLKALSKKQRVALELNGPAEGHDEISAGWVKWARTIERHRASLGTLAVVAMLALAIPTLSIRLGTTDAGGDPKGTTTRQAYDLLAKGFGAGFNGPLQVVVMSGPDKAESINTLTSKIAAHPNVAKVTPAITLPNSNITMMQVYPGTSPQSKQTTDLIDSIRKDVTHPYTQSTGTDVYIGGQTAIFHDFTNVLASKYALFLGVVVGLSFLLLMAVFRSLLIPFVASLMNLLSAGAAFGVVVAVFQWGWGASILGITQTGPIQAFLPVMAFAILFGLSMDYEVFLVSRMYEEWHRTRDNRKAIELGQAETGRVITAAAAIMIVVFGSFAFGGNSTIKLFGVSLASAVLLDALIVRTVLVPALMHAFGNGNWYLPAWLDRILPRINVEARETDAAAKVN